MSIMQMSIQAGLLICVIIIIRVMALNKLPKVMFLILWGVTLLKLLVPFSFSSQFSIYGIIENAINYTGTNSTSVLRTAIQPLSGLIQGQVPIQTGQINTYHFALTTTVWLIGTFILLTFFVIWYLKSSRKLRFSIPVHNNLFINEWMTEHRLFRPLVVQQSDRITTPLAAGMIHPRIILPKTLNTSDTNLMQYVLTHEYIHIRRFDMLWKLLALSAVCIHWFNPLVWVMLILLNRDLEITCDEMVLSHIGADKKTTYAYSLINMAEQSKLTPFYNNFSKNATEERITSIMKFKKPSAFAIAFAVVLTALVTTIFTATTKEQTNKLKYDKTSDTLTASYDSEGNLIYYQVRDEDGNIVHLDYQPEPAPWDLHINGEEDHGLYSITVSCTNGLSESHNINNGMAAIYMNDGSTWALEKGQELHLKIDITDKDWWGILLGYYKDGEYYYYDYDANMNYDQRTIISGKTIIKFIAPEDGEYNPFIVNHSASTMKVNSCTISY